MISIYKSTIADKVDIINPNLIHKFVIITLLMVITVLISCEVFQFTNAITMQDSHKLGYKEGCHKILTSTDRNNIDYIIHNNISSEIQIYKKGFVSGALDLINGECSPYSSSMKNSSDVSQENPFYIIQSGSMEPLLYKGSMIAANYSKTLFNNLKIGDVILFKPLDPSEDNKTIVHRIIKIFQAGDAFDEDSYNNLCSPNMIPNTFSEKTIMTQGDANPCSYPNMDIPITQKNYIGKAIFVIVKDSFIEHLIPIVDKLSNLSKILEKELNTSGIKYSNNIMMAKNINAHLTEASSIINKFNNTETIAKYAKVKEFFDKAFDNLFKAYNLQNDYLKSNNFDVLKRSSDYAYLSHKYMTNAYNLLLQSSSKTKITNNY